MIFQMNNYVEAKPVASYKHLDSEWYKTAEGDACVQQLFSAQNQCRKQFGKSMYFVYLCFMNLYHAS